MTLQFHEEIARAKCEFFKRREIAIKNLPPVTYQEIKDFLKGYCVVDIAISKKSRQAIVTLKNGGEAEEIVRRFDQTMLFNTVVGVSLYPNTRLLCVSNIPTHVSHQQFVNFVSTFGKVNKCFLMGFVHPAPNSSKHKGYGFVEFLHNVQKIEECRQTINGYLVWNSVLHCCQATSQLLTFNDLHSMVLRIDNLPQSSQQVDSVVKSLINLSRLQIVKLVGGEKCILAEFKTFIDTEAAYHALRHVTVGPHRLHTQFCLPGFSLDELEADLKELDRLKKIPSISDTTATLQSIIDQNGAVNGNSLVHQNIMLLMSAFHKDHAVAAVPSAPIPAPLPIGVSANPCLPSHIATITGMGVNNARAQTLPATGQVHINHASLQAADRVPASSVTSRGHHCSSVNSTLNTTKPTPLTAPTPLTVSTPSNILLPVPQVLQKVASTESRDSQSHVYCSETTNKLYSLSDPTCFQLPDDYHGDEHYVNHVIKQTPIQKNLQVLSASQQLQHNPIDNPLPLATALIPSGLLVPPVTLSDDLMSKHRRVDLKSTPLMPTVDGVQPLSEAILNIVGQGTSLVPNQVQSQRPGVVSGAEHGHVLGSHDMNSTVKDNELFNQAKLLRGLNGLGDGSNVENENHSLLKTPVGMSRKRSHPSLLPPPEPSPEGDYIGQHSQGIGGHYAESYRKRKRIL